MGTEKPSDRWRAVMDPPSEVQIKVTVVRRPRRHPLQELRERVRAFIGAHTMLALVFGVALLTAMVVGALQIERVGASGNGPAQHVSRAEATEIAAAYGYPLECLSITTASSVPDFARAHIDRRGTCARYRGYVNASFHRVGGVWRLVLDEGQLFVPNRRLGPCDGSGAASC